MGTLYVVGTPIGNLEDITQRALRVLAEASVIAAEDTRHTRKLLTHFGIRTPMVSYHEHNQRKAGPEIISRLQRGDSVALVTDAGMPGISDPGEDLIRLAVDAGLPVIAIPGPTALVTALVLSGLSTERFVFEGFLPQRKRDRTAALHRVSQEQRTTVLYEAPHRLLDTLSELRVACGERLMTVARELTKLHEQVLRGTPSELLAHFSTHAPRGEIVLVVSGVPVATDIQAEPAGPQALALAVAALEEQGLQRKEAMKEVAQRFGLTKRDVYQALLEVKGEQ